MTRLITLSGFLGAGKTTTLIAGAKALAAKGSRVAVVTNDQTTDLVDTKLVRSHLDAVGEVAGGCFCCKFEDLVTVIQAILDGAPPDEPVDTVIMEAVGSCTDLQATVLRPLTAYYGEGFRVAPLTTVVDPLRYRAFERAAARGEIESDLAYLFGRQLAEAEVIALNKCDLVQPAVRDEVVGALAERYPAAAVVPYSATSRDGFDAVVAAWDTTSTWSGDLDIDYDRYAAAEADLAWLNLTVTLDTAGSGGFPALDWATALLRRLSESCAAAGTVVGHAKVTVESGAALTKASITAAGQEPVVDAAADGPVAGGTATVNARVATDPTALEAVVADAVGHADAVAGARSRIGDGSAFRPSYPRPVHRMTAAQATG